MAVASSTYDPSELDRLVEELAIREGITLDGEDSTSLPTFTPLSRDNIYLNDQTFDVEQFLLSRVAHADLPELRTELREYLGALKEELVQLINDDYEAFISLSTDLRGEGETLEGLIEPLGELRTVVLTSRTDLTSVQDSIEAKLQQRNSLRAEKDHLQLLLKVSDSVNRLESLLLIKQNTVETGSDLLTNGTEGPLPTSDHDLYADRGRQNRAKHLARVAAEYTQLLYYINKAQAKPSAFIDEIQWRVDRVKSTLSTDLDHLFSITMRALSDGKESGLSVKASESDKARLMADMFDCLRTYDTLGLWRDAEDVLRRDIVREFVKKTVYSGALAAPRSPMAPATPFLNDGYLSTHGPATASMPPRTPYTPFSAFVTKQNPFDYFGSGGQASSAHLLEESGDPLATLYNQLLRFVEKDMVRILESAERICVKSGTRAKEISGRPSSALGVTDPAAVIASREETPGFEIMANVIWAEMARTIMDELGSTIFAAGKPDQFRKNHETTQAFLRALEFLAPSVGAIESMREHPSFKAFERRWQLPVYFQLRWKEIINAVEVALSSDQVHPGTSTDQSVFVTTQGAAVWNAITRCWSAEVYIPELSHRFWKLTLQLLSRFRTWLDASLPRLEDLESTGITSSASGQPLTPVGENVSTEANAADTQILRQLAIAILDVNAMQKQMVTLWQQEVSMMLPEDNDSSDGTNQTAEDALRTTLATATAMTPTWSEHISIILTRQCSEAVAPAKSIPAQVRMSKRASSEPSTFVAGILRPVRAFFGIQALSGGGEKLKEDLLTSCALDAFDGACKRYTFYLTSWKKAEESLRRINKAQKSTFSLFGTSKPSRDDKNRDDERIRTQLIIDVNAFSQDAQSLGVDVESCASFIALRDLVHASLVDETQGST